MAFHVVCGDPETKSIAGAAHGFNSASRNWISVVEDIEDLHLRRIVIHHQRDRLGGTGDDRRTITAEEFRLELMNPGSLADRVPL